MFRDINTFYVDPVDADELLQNAAMGMVVGLDPYTEYFGDEDVENFEILTTGRYAGIGSLISQKDDFVIFAEPYKNSPADKAGIEIGDKIVEIEGRDAKGLTTAEVSAILKGEAGSTVSMKVEKFYTGETVEMKIKRELISMPAIPYYGMLDDTVGYIYHSDFMIDSANQFRNAVMSLREQGAESLVLDYRNNGGGIMSEAVQILSLFMPKGTEVVSMRGRMEDTNAVFVTTGEPIDIHMPIVVLINSNSASAAEIVAGAIQDLDRGVLIGRRSFGKGLVQSTRPMSDNSFLKITTAKYYLPSGRCIQAIDYASRGEDGSIKHIPDSLVSEFRTAGGRLVFDGGGVSPDIMTPIEYVSRFALILYAKGYISDFADIYSKENYGREINPVEFALTDADFERFIEFMDDKDVEWESETSKLLKQLTVKATQERYYDAVEEQLKSIAENIKDDKQTNLMLHKEEIIDLIENTVLLRTSYAQGVTEHNIHKDPEIERAVEVLNDIELYKAILDGMAHSDASVRAGTEANEN